MTRKVCRVEGCEGSRQGQGLCGKHYWKYRKYGDPLAGRTRHKGDKERFYQKVSKDSYGCWIWTGSIDHTGYGAFSLCGKVRRAHRAVLSLEGMTVPDDMYVDHICHVKSCVNPDHLRIVTRKQNQEHRKGAQANNLSSGVRGVYFDKGKWAARLKHNGMILSFGRYCTIDEAAEAIEAAREELFTHDDYGKWAKGRVESDA